MTIQNQKIDPATIQAVTFEQGEGKPVELVLTFKDKKEVTFKVGAGYTKAELIKSYDELQLALMEFRQRSS